jgi:hypothetical protein
MNPSNTNIVAITVVGGIAGAVTAKKHKFVGTLGGALLGAIIGSVFEQFGPKVGTLNPRTSYDRGQGQ